MSNLNLLISNCNAVILFLDSLEEQRLLFNTEANLRILVKEQIAKLPHYKKIYWKNRYTVNRIKLGDECTKFFHSMATISLRRNSIAQLVNADGAAITDHAGKVDLVWSSFKGKMGVTTSPSMLFNLQELINADDHLESLADHFQEADINAIIRRMPSDKALGPDRFNGHFLKTCWQIIKQDFYQLCEEFYNGQANLECINESLITLVPKNQNPESVSDYRPISILNSSLKIITKLLVDRLQGVILRLVHKNQYGFIRSRSIQDCLAWCFEYIHQCK